MKTFKVNKNQWREQVMQALNLEYTIIGNKIVYKGYIGEYNSLVSLLVSEAQKLKISTH